MKLRQIIYAVIIAFSMGYVFVNQKYCKHIEIINGYVKDFSVSRGDDLIVYLHPAEEHKLGVVLIYNLKGFIVDSLICKLQFEDTTTSANFFENGYSYKHSVSYNTSKLKSGIYFINKNIPFIVKEPKLINALTVVFPFANMHTLFNKGGKSFYGYNSKNNKAATKLSLHRNLVISDYTISFLNWIDSLYSLSNVNIITDLDLEEYSNIANAKTVVIYGNSAFWTYKARCNFDKFQCNNGNILAITTSLMNNKFRFEKKTNTLVFTPSSDKDYCKNINDKTGQWSEPIFKNPNYNSVGGSYEVVIGSKPNKSYGGFKIAYPNHSIFKNVVLSTIQFKANAYNSIKIIHNAQSIAPIADEQFGCFYSKKILAFDFGTYNNKTTLGGIFLMQKTRSSGKLLIIGSSDWCEIENFRIKNVQIVTKNSIDFLMN